MEKSDREKEVTIQICSVRSETQYRNIYDFYDRNSTKFSLRMAMDVLNETYLSCASVMARTWNLLSALIPTPKYHLEQE